MTLTTTHEVPGRPVARILGVARGNTIRTGHAGCARLAARPPLSGRGIADSTKAAAEAREQAMDRLVEHAGTLGADAAIGLRFPSAEVMRNAAEIFVYGTAAEGEAPRT